MRSSRDREAHPLETVYLVEDDDDVRDSTSMLLRASGFTVEGFRDGDAFETALPADAAGCCVLDVRLPGRDGLALHQALTENGIGLPVIFITGHGDIPMAVRAVAAGALDFLEKPFDETALIDRIEKAFEIDRRRRSLDLAQAGIDARIERLTAREHDVLRLILDGRPNKVIAYELDVSIRTVEIHRANVMRKLECTTASDLVRTALSSTAYRNRIDVAER
ncbi:response regulator [Fodinicurvata sp. EGI_FJ10296]|uniref:response regulator transcription factor n=1 Tax=Fodinicurvata sp. EGI_FJ10296 TaxID=3231908 RepID=UPI003451BF2B